MIKSLFGIKKQNSFSRNRLFYIHKLHRIEYDRNFVI